MPRKVYRLEDKTGNGPYSGDQVCVNYLAPHHDPENLMFLCGLPKEVLQALSQAQFLFGWRRLSDYKKFFKQKGQIKCRELGFDLVVYRPELRFDFPDGQVMFAKPGVSIETPYLKTLLKALEKMKTK